MTPSGWILFTHDFQYKLSLDMAPGGKQNSWIVPTFNTVVTALVLCVFCGETSKLVLRVLDTLRPKTGPGVRQILSSFVCVLGSQTSSSGCHALQPYHTSTGLVGFLFLLRYTEKAPNAWQHRGTQKTRSPTILSA